MIYFYRFIWIICVPFIKAYYIIKGYIRLKTAFRVGDIYYVSETNVYYKYLGDRLFKEGNRMVDTGFLAIEVPGHTKMLSYLQIGMMHFMFIRKETSSLTTKRIWLKRKKK